MMLRDGALPEDDSTVLIHLGAGQSETVWKAVERSYDLYRPLPTLRAGEHLGAFGLSLYGLVDGVELGQLFYAFPYGQYGRATFGAVREVFAVHATATVSDTASDDARRLQRAHFSLLLAHPECPELAQCLYGDLPQSVRESLRATVVEQIEGSLLPLFAPRSPRPS